MLPFSSRFLGMCPIKVFRVVSILTLCSSSMMSVTHGAPESMGIPIIKSLLDRSSSPDGLKEMMEAHSDKLFQQLNKPDQPEPNPTHLNNLLSKLKPKQGRMDPVVADMLSAFDRKYRDTTAVTGGHSGESYNFPNEPATNRMASSTEENGIIWQGATNRPRRRDNDSSKFSSRYRSNKTEPVLKDYGGNRTGIYNDTDHNHSVPPTLPFNHITDPNIRNHRLYDWEFETYKNFTHIDQAEDLMADEDHISETKVSVVAAPPLNLQKSQKQSGTDRAGASIKNGHHGPKSKRVKVKGIPHIVISLEDTSDHGPYNHHGSNGYNLHLPVDSGERLLQRPREPLRHSSTENIVYVHGTSGEDTLRSPWSDPRGSTVFRPSSSDLTDAVFIDPDQDFFTSTIRSGDPHNLNQDQEISSEAQSKRRRKKLKKYSNNEELASGSRFNNRMGEMSHDTDSHNYNGHSQNQISEEDQPNPNIVYSPVYSRNTLVGVNDAGEASRAHNGNVHQTPGPHMPLIKPSYHTVENSHIKSDRILYPGSEHQHMESIVGQVQPVAANFDSYQHQHQQQLQPSGHHLDLNGGIGNYYQLHSEPAQHVITTNMGGIPSASENVHPFGHKNQQELTSTEYLGGSMNRLQNALSSLPFNFFGLQQQQTQQQSTKKLMASPADQVIAPGNIEDFYHPYAAADHQVNQYYEDNPYYSNPWSNTWFVLAAIIGFTAVFALVMPSLISPGRLGKKDTRHDLDEDDINSSSSNYPNYYNNYQFDNTTNDVQQNSDIWTEIKGVYNDIVNLFRGDFNLLSKLRKEPEGPKIVYRDENDNDQEDSDEDDEDDEKSDNRVPLRHRKRQDYLKKQKMLKKQQQNKRQRERERERDRGNKSSKKSLISKTKAEAGRDNKTHGKTIDATSVNNLVVVSGPGGPTARDVDENHSSPRTVTGFVFPENSTLATMPVINATGFGSMSDSFLREWAEVQLINHLNH